MRGNNWSDYACPNSRAEQPPHRLAELSLRWTHVAFDRRVVLRHSVSTRMPNVQHIAQEIDSTRTRSNHGYY
eukprot:scaffold502300_cov19-Prasinocladus_malaysianus.AAC.1